MRPIRTLIIAAALAVSCFGSAWAQEMTASELLAQVDRGLNPESFESYRKLINIELDGTKKEFVLYTVKKGRDKVVALFMDPPSERGRATLRVGDNMWLYIPEVGKPLRITSLQSVTGGIFNNSDILSVDYAVEYDATDMTDQGDTYLLDLKAKTDMIAYDRLKMTVAKDTLTPVDIEAFGASGLLIKSLHFKELKDYGDGIRRPAVVETDSPLYKGYLSVMIFAKMAPRDLSDEVFTLNYLPKVEELR